MRHPSYRWAATVTYVTATILLIQAVPFLPAVAAVAAAGIGVQLLMPERPDA